LVYRFIDGCASVGSVEETGVAEQSRLVEFSPSWSAMRELISSTARHRVPARRPRLPEEAVRRALFKGEWTERDSWAIT
jgi:hypothetical protein